MDLQLSVRKVIDMKLWSFAEMQDFIERNRPDNKDLAYTYVFYNIGGQDPEQVLQEFDKWVVAIQRTPLNELNHKVGQLLVRTGNRLMNERPNLRIKR